MTRALQPWTHPMRWSPGWQRNWSVLLRNGRASWANLQARSSSLWETSGLQQLRNRCSSDLRLVRFRLILEACRALTQLHRQSEGPLPRYAAPVLASICLDRSPVRISFGAGLPPLEWAVRIWLEYTCTPRKTWQRGAWHRVYVVSFTGARRNGPKCKWKLYCDVRDPSFAAVAISSRTVGCRSWV